MTKTLVASTFASFCQNFSDACDDITLTTSTAEPTDDSTGDNSDDSSTTEETDNPTETEDEDAAANTNEPGAGAILRVSTVTALAALFALLVVW